MKLNKKTHNSLSRNSAPIQLALLGMVAGILAGLVVNLFRFVLEAPFPFLGLASHHDDFESMSTWVHFFLPVTGSIVLAAIFSRVPLESRILGVPHVIDKVQNLKGHMPIKNALLQFAGTSLALLSGQSCGREGPAIHLGATSGSALGRFFNLPNNSIRILIACGSAAAISSSFNTPIAGVIFTMEVILMEYTIANFIPVIMAAVSGAVVTQIFYGNDPVFVIENIRMESLWELPYVIFMGVVIGVLASTFIVIEKYCMTFSSVDIRARFIFAGLLTGCLAIFSPQIMGTGYDTLNEALVGEFLLSSMFLVLCFKLIITPVILGLGIPGGVIGPTLVLGGMIGAVLGIVGDMALPSYSSNPSFYVLLGMCAMMGAVLQAPLAALMAMLELSNNPNTILPGMLIIVVANLTAGEVFGLPSIFQISLQQQGIKTPKTISRLLNHYGVSSIMKSQVTLLKTDTPADGIQNIEEEETPWLIMESGGSMTLFPTREVQMKLSSASDNSALQDIAGGKSLAAISLHATLQEALEILQEANLENGYIFSPIGLGGPTVLGIISVDDIIAFYKDR